jgi:hypothetical protein
MLNDQPADSMMTLIHDEYQSFESPDFSFVEEAISSRPYERVVQQIGTKFQVEEDTDPNDDVSFGYFLTNGPQHWVLRISMLGPYAVLLRVSDSERAELVTSSEEAMSDAERDLLHILADNEVSLLAREVLLQPVPLSLFNAEDTRVYQALFTDTDILPWE